MQITQKILLVSLLLSILFSCQEKRLNNFDLDSAEGSKLYIKSFMMADNQGNIILRKTVHPLSSASQNDRVSGALITLLENGSPIAQLIELSPGEYKTDSMFFQGFLSGRDYAFQVVTDSFPILNSLADTIPEKVLWERDSVIVSDDSSYVRLYLHFKATENIQNYYILDFSTYINGSWQIESPDETGTYIYNLAGLSQYRQPSCIIGFNAIGPMLLGTCIANQKISIVLTVPTRRYVSSRNRNVPPNVEKFRIVLRNTTKSSYEYYKSLQAQHSGNDDPFSNPVSVYSNITGGYGIVAGFAADTLTFDVW